ncbi:hypothetical protein [Arthrobacter agilis]|uniref:hypothetical protein n=1 Tax=Arthrobacter agilis TaxID=37921 RepID=UPI0027D81FB8|nr:hypothetical protein [Arthrobacter agilis]
MPHPVGIVAIVGNLVGGLALLVSAGAVAYLLTLTGSGNSISSVFEDDVAGTTTIAFPTLMALLSTVGFFFGQFGLRGQWGGGTPSAKEHFTVDLRPLTVRSHALLLGFALLAWAAVMVIPLVLDSRGALAADDGSSALDQYWFVVTVYGAITGAVTAMVGTSLVKKLTYNASLRRRISEIRAGSPSQTWWRSFSHTWRAELGIGGLGGAALGLAPLGLHLNSATYALSFAAVGTALLITGLVLALNAWRSGMPVERVESYT